MDSSFKDTERFTAIFVYLTNLNAFRYFYYSFKTVH